MTAAPPVRTPAAPRSRRAVQIVLTALALVVTSVVAGPVPAATAAPVDAWPSTSGGADNTTYNPGESVVTAGNGQRLRQAWSVDVFAGMIEAPAVVRGVAYHVTNPDTASQRSRFVATSVRTGSTLWTMVLPADASVHEGMTVSGTMALLPYSASAGRGGVIAVDLVKRAIVWKRGLPKPAASWISASTAGPLTVDDGRVFVGGAGNVVNALRLSDGAPLWTMPWDQFTVVDGFAADNGIVYTGGDGIIAYDGATGRRLWAAPGGGEPLVAGGRVFAFSGETLTAVSAGGCGAVTCPALWQRTISALDEVHIGGVTGSTLVIAYTRPNRSSGVVARLSAATGKQLWSAPTGPYPDQVARGGNAVWLIVNGTSLVGFSAAATGTKPLRVIPLPSERQGGHQGVVVSGGTVLVESWPRYLTGYRIPGT